MAQVAVVALGEQLGARVDLMVVARVVTRPPQATVELQTRVVAVVVAEMVVAQEERADLGS